MNYKAVSTIIILDFGVALMEMKDGLGNVVVTGSESGGNDGLRVVDNTDPNKS